MEADADDFSKRRRRNLPAGLVNGNVKGVQSGSWVVPEMRTPSVSDGLKNSWNQDPQWVNGANSTKNDRSFVLPSKRGFGFGLGEQLEGFVRSTPLLDVGPVEPGGSLHLHHRDDIGEVLGPLGAAAPAEFLDDDVM